MSDSQSNPSAVPSGRAPDPAPTEGASSTAAPAPAPTEATTDRSVAPAGNDKRSASARGEADPLRGSRASGIWVAVLALVVVIILLSVFIAQNTQTVQVSYLGWSGSAPLSATLLIAAAGGALLVAAAGALRILQLRHRIKKARKRG